MPTVIEIVYQADRAQAIDILADAGETYHCAPEHRFIVSDRAPQLLSAGGVRFSVLGRERLEEERGPENATNA
jgi:hypothetical protein